MFELFVSVFAALFSVVNPFGAVPIFLAMTPHYTEAERRSTAYQTSIYFCLILIAFFFAGSYILSFFGITLNAIRIAGGIIILNSGFALLAGRFKQNRAITKKVQEEALQKEDISFSPLAMPLLSGPGSISLLISLYAENEGWAERFLIAGVIVLTAALVYLTLRSAPYLYQLMGESGLNALSRIMGFLVMAIGIQYIIVSLMDLGRQLLGMG